MNITDITRLSRTASFSLAGVAASFVFAPAVTAQLAPGDIVVSMAAPAGLTYQLIPAAGGAVAAIPGFIGPIHPTAFEIDSISGDILYIDDSSSAGLTLRRATIGPAQTVTSDTAFYSVPNSANELGRYLHREPTGGYVLLSRLNGGSQQYVRRIGVGSAGAVSYLVATLPGTFLHTDMTVDNLGNILLVGPANSSFTDVLRISFNGANQLASAFRSNNVRGYAIEFNPTTNRILVGGDTLLAIGPAPYTYPNFHSSGGGSAVSVTPGNAIIDLHRIPGTSTMLAAFNSSGAPSTIALYTTSGNPQPIGPTLFTAPGGATFAKISSFSPSEQFGYPRETISGSLPVSVSSPTAPPPSATTGADWVVDISGLLTTGSTSLGFAFYTMGFNDTDSNGTPLPYDLTPAGYTRCALFVSDGQTVYVGATAAGTATFTWNIPVDPGLVGLQLFSQWSSFDGQTAVQSNALTVTL